MQIIKYGDILSELNHNGHRERLRKMYLSGGMENAPEHNLLELFLTTIIPRKDVKPIAYNLINTFGSLEGVLNASAKELMLVDGIGEQSAVAISLVKTMMSKVNNLEVSKKKKFSGFNDVCEYCQKVFMYENVEKLLLITLDNGNSIINTHIVETGTSNELNAPISKIVRFVTLDDASGIILAHNHPRGSCAPSASDMSYTVELKSVLQKLSVKLIDHIICGADGFTSVTSKLNKLSF